MIANINTANTNKGNSSTSTSGIGSNVLMSKAQSDSWITLFGAGAISSARDNGQTGSIKTNILDIEATTIRNKDQSDSLIANINTANTNTGNISTNTTGIGSNVLISKAQSDTLITLVAAGAMSSARDNGQTDSI